MPLCLLSEADFNTEAFVIDFVALVLWGLSSSSRGRNNLGLGEQKIFKNVIKVVIINK